MVYRIYYNRSEDWPYVWSLDEGTSETEQTVMAVIILPPCVTSTHYTGKTRNPDEPVAWLEIAGNLEIKDDVAFFD
jgi:hypothetical protein